MASERPNPDDFSKLRFRVHDVRGPMGDRACIDGKEAGVEPAFGAWRRDRASHEPQSRQVRGEPGREEFSPRAVGLRRNA
jgi:hypothetical protein